MTNPSPTNSDLAQSAAAEKTQLVQSVRAELIKAQITILELQDQLLQKETDKADAISLLGQAELALESKIDYIFELDRVLNEKITAISAELTRVQSDHEAITQDLVRKLDLTNRELGATHQLAGNYARDAALAREQLSAAAAQLATTTTSLAQLQANFESLSANYTAANELIATLRAELARTAEDRDTCTRELASIRGSFVWKVTAPLRVLFGSKP